MKRISAEKAKELLDAATPGPWFVGFTDDAAHMCSAYVSTVDRGQNHDNRQGMGPDRHPEDVVAIVLLQSPPLAISTAERWDEDAALIAAAPDLAATVVALEAERDEALARCGRLEGVLASLVDPDACWYDQRGGCQAHGFLELAPGEQCPNETAKMLLVDDEEVKP